MGRLPVPSVLLFQISGFVGGYLVGGVVESRRAREELLQSTIPLMVEKATTKCSLSLCDCRRALGQEDYPERLLPEADFPWLWIVLFVISACFNIMVACLAPLFRALRGTSSMPSSEGNESSPSSRQALVHEQLALIGRRRHRGFSFDAMCRAQCCGVRMSFAIIKLIRMLSSPRMKTFL